ncbi:unnamed protein product [Prorocentrum cordatum]|uniref:Uncharacterized protein n=1 Tax=Prorocentrum cordatum TaxID=2364126 RepID=A0ABN9VX49_9DINO|nr:unnamed protein product [Polarella glacialis]
MLPLENVATPLQSADNAAASTAPRRSRACQFGGALLLAYGALNACIWKKFTPVYTATECGDQRAVLDELSLGASSIEMSMQIEVTCTNPNPYGIEILTSTPGRVFVKLGEMRMQIGDLKVIPGSSLPEQGTGTIRVRMDAKLSGEQADALLPHFLEDSAVPMLMEPMGKDAAKGYLSCSSCRYRWNWKSREHCFSCGNALVPSPPPPWRQAKGVWSPGGEGGGQQGPAHPPGTWAPSRLEAPRVSTPPQRGAGQQPTMAELLTQPQQHVKADAGAQELQALVKVVAPPAPAQPARQPLLEETISAEGVACRRAEKALEHAVHQEDEARRWLAECSQRAQEAAVWAVQAKTAWQEELKAELQKARGSAPGAGPPPEAVHVPTGSQINLSQLEIEIEDEDKQRWLALKSNMAAEIQKAIVAAIGPSADNIQRLRAEARDMRKRLSAKRARQSDSGDGTGAAAASQPGTPPPAAPVAPPAAGAAASGAEPAGPGSATTPTGRADTPSAQELQAAVDAARAKLAEGGGSGL